MSKRKCLSAEEKRCKLLELFHETCDVFQLKDLEKRAPKEKGIVMQSVKAVLQELVDSGEVRSEKISGSVFYWSFPSDALNKVKKDLEDYEKSIAEIDTKIYEKQKQLDDAKKNVADVEASDALHREIEVLEKEYQDLKQKLAKYSNEFDYVELDSKDKNTKRFLEAANRWTDNIFMTKSWCKKKFGKEDRELNKAFGIPDDLDYVEDD